MSRCILILAISLLFAPLLRAGPQLLENRKIWDAGKHNAFTDLIRWHDRWWCTFREADDHVGGDGLIRVIVSDDAQTWQSAALISEKDIDLRDPKFSVTPDDRLMIVAGGSVYLGTKQIKGRQPRVFFSGDGRQWTPPQTILLPGDWLWRVTWHKGTAYGVTYYAAGSQKPAHPWELRLVSSIDGINWQDLSPMEVSGQPNETTLRFLPDDTLIAMVRREAGSKRGWVGVAKAPYRQWTWHESNYQFGGPNFIVLPDGSMLAGTRDYTQRSKHTTLIAKMTLDELSPLLTLPSSGDTSYPGMVFHDGVLYFSYYSSHEGKTSIYLARLKP